MKFFGEQKSSKSQDLKPIVELLVLFCRMNVLDQIPTFSEIPVTKTSRKLHNKLHDKLHGKLHVKFWAPLPGPTGTLYISIFISKKQALSLPKNIESET